MDSNQKRIYCVGRRHCFNTFDIIKDEKNTPQTQKVKKGKCDFCTRNICRIFTK